MSVLHPHPATDLLRDPSEVGNLDDATIQWLLRQGVSTSAIASPLALRSGRVVYDPHVDLYTPNPLGEFALILPVMADPATTLLDLQAVDLVAWSPSSRRIATRLGGAFALGEEQIGVGGAGTTGLPIPMHRSPLSWLRHGRHGLVIADWTVAPFALSGLILQAEGERHRAELLRGLTPVPPTVVVPVRRAAA